MKKINVILLVTALISTSSFAKSAGTAKATTDTTTYSKSAPHTSSGASGQGIGLGVTTYSALGGTGGISAIIPVGQNVVQTSFYMGTSGGFTFGITGLYKSTVYGNSDTGFHVGGGLGLGVSGTSSTTTTVAGTTFTVPGTSSFSLSLGGVAGFHHEIVPNKIQMAFDAGPVLTLTPAVAFSVVPYSAIAGFSIHYFL